MTEEQIQEIINRRDNLTRKTRDGLAIYKEDENPSPGVYRAVHSKTLVPEGGEIDNEIKSHNEVVSSQKGAVNMARGGFIPTNPNQIFDPLNSGTSQQMPPMAQPPMPTMPAMPASAPTPAPVTPGPVIPPIAATPTLAMKLPGMPESVTPDDLEGYLSQQKSSINKFGPEQMTQMQQNINANQGSFGNRLTSGVKGFADALMMGVAGAGDPGWQKDYEQQQNFSGQQNLDTMGKANEMNLKRTDAGMSLDKMDPKSPLSKQSQQTYAPLFEKLGYRAGDIDGMSSANIDNALQLMTAYGGKEIEAQIKQYEIEIEKMRLSGALSHQSAEENMAQSKNQQDALQELAKMPWYSRILHPGVSGALKEQAGLEKPTDTASHPQSQEALQWAQSNPTDPRAVEILKRLGH